MQKTIKAFIHKSESYYVAECVGINVVTQGKTLDETVANLQEAVSLHLEGEHPAVMHACLNARHGRGIPHERPVLPPPRPPEKVREFALSARDRGIEVIIA